jgi:hypothetical protein
MANSNIPIFKVDPIVVLLLGFITCGLYLIYWNIKVAEVMNAVAKRDEISTAVAVFAGLCTPVNIYFYYIIGKNCLPKVHQETGNAPKDQSILLMVLGFIFPMVAAMIVQGEINKLY